MSTIPEKMDDDELSRLIEAADQYMRRYGRNQLIALFTVGFTCMLLAIFIARMMTHGDIQELKSLIASQQCRCDPHAMRATATAGNVTVSPDGNSFGQLTRDVLRTQGAINDLRGTSSATGSTDR